MDAALTVAANEEGATLRIGQLDQEHLAAMMRAAGISTKVVLTPFDPVDYLDSEDAIAEFIEAARETGDEEYIAHAGRVADRARRKLSVTR